MYTEHQNKPRKFETVTWKKKKGVRLDMDQKQADSKIVPMPATDMLVLNNFKNH